MCKDQLTYEKGEKMGILSKLANFLTIENSHAQQICKKNLEPIELEQEEKMMIFSNTYMDMINLN